MTSALTLAECNRAVIRGRVTDRLSATEERDALRALLTLARRCTVLAVTDAILQRAGRAFPVEPIRTLDAIHLATLDVLGDPPPLVTIVTRDSRVRPNALALGYLVE